MSVIDRVIAYVAGLDPAFPRSIAGASPGEIDRLRQLADRPLPPVYVDFLRTMGRGSGWLTLNRSRTGIDAVTAFHQAAGTLLPEEYVVIGVSGIDPYYHVHLEARPPKEPRVVSFPHRPAGWEHDIPASSHELAGSLAELLCSYAFRTAKLVRFPERQCYSQIAAAPGSLARAEAAVRRMGGFQKLWFSTDTGCYFQREDCVIRTTERPATPLALEFAAANRGMAEAARMVFAQEFDLRPIRF